MSIVRQTTAKRYTVYTVHVYRYTVCSSSTYLERVYLLTYAKSLHNEVHGGWPHVSFANARGHEKELLCNELFRHPDHVCMLYSVASVTSPFQLLDFFLLNRHINCLHTCSLAAHSETYCIDVYIIWRGYNSNTTEHFLRLVFLECDMPAVCVCSLTLLKRELTSG